MNAPLKPITGKNNVFRKVSVEQYRKEPGTWFMLECSGGKRIPAVVCPGCRGGALSLKDHHVAADGKVTPSLGCPFCGYHEFITLKGWI